MLLRGISSEGVWNVFFYLVKLKNDDIPCRFCGCPNGDGHLFWDCPFPPLVLGARIVPIGPGACYGMVGILGSLPGTSAPFGQ